MKKLNKCPICGYQGNVEKHIVQKARHEVWIKAIKQDEKTPHFDYYLKNTKPVLRYYTKRTWQ